MMRYMVSMFCLAIGCEAARPKTTLKDVLTLPEQEEAQNIQLPESLLELLDQSDYYVFRKNIEAEIKTLSHLEIFKLITEFQDRNPVKNRIYKKRVRLLIKPFLEKTSVKLRHEQDPIIKSFSPQEREYCVRKRIDLPTGTMNSCLLQRLRRLPLPGFNVKESK